MAQPPTYDRQYNFSGFQALFPSTPLPANEVDAEYNSIKTTLDATLANLAVIQNSDTTLGNQTVGPAQLSSQMVAGFTAPTIWVTATAYVASPASTVLQSSAFYICLISHTSGVFATDLAAGKWLKIIDLSAIVVGTATQVAVSAHGSNIVTNVQTSLNNLEDNKAAASHTHTVAQITDVTSDGAAFVKTNLAGQKTLLGLGSLAFLNSVAVTAISAQLAFTGKTTYSLAGNINDLAPTNWSTSAVLEITPSNNFNITGFAATTDGDTKLIDNVGTHNITFTSNDTSSASANRIAVPRPLVLRPGQAAVLKYDGTNTVWRLQSPVPTNPSAGTFQNLIQGNAGPTAVVGNYTAPGTPDTQFTITVDNAVLKDANGETWQTGQINVTISTGTTGAVNGLESAFSLVSQKIFTYLIGNPTTNSIGGLMSVSATAPTLPSGYTFSMRTGATFTDASSHLKRTLQVNRRGWYVVDSTHAYPLLASGASGTINTTTFTQASPTSLTGIVPTTAYLLGVMLSTQNTGGGTAADMVALAPSNNFGGPQSANPAPLIFSSINNLTPVKGEMMIESTSGVFYAAVVASSQVLVTHWDDSL